MVTVPQDLDSVLYETKRAGSVRVTIHEQISSVKDDWYALEKVGVCSVYQRYDWVKAWTDAVAPSIGISPRLVVGALGAKTLFIFPLGLMKHGPLTVATWLGDSHSNFLMGIMDKSFATGIDREDMQTLFDGISSQLGAIDLVNLPCQPVHWQGVQNPLHLLPSRESNNHAYALDITGGLDQALDRKNGARMRKKFRWQQNKVAEYGGAHLRVASTEADVDRVLNTAFSQMAIRLGAAGISNRFADQGVETFVRRVAKLSLGQSEPQLLLFSLEIGGTIRATLAGGVFRDQFSGCFLSYANDELAHISPGEMIIYLALEDSVARGLSYFDLGRGEERYKSSWCDTKIELFETRRALTTLGKAFMVYQNGKLAIKGRIRNNSRLWAMAKKARAALLGRTTG